MTVTVWLNIAARLITPTEQGERLFRDDVRSSVRDQTSPAPRYKRARTKDAGTDGRRGERAESASQPRYAVVTCPLAYSFAVSIFPKAFETHVSSYVRVFTLHNDLISL